MCSRSTLVCCLAVVVATLAAVFGQRQQLYEGDICKQVAGINWTCKRFADCPKALEDRRNGLRPETCGFSDNQVIVCCQPTQTTQRLRPPTQTTQRPRPTTQTTQRHRPPTQTTQRPRPTTQTTERPRPTTQRPRPTTQPKEVGRKSKQMCKKYGESVVKKEEDDFGYIQTFNLCLFKPEPLITNGTEAHPREFPHMALIGYGRNDSIEWKCGGSLISERWVLSAAHCTLAGKNRAKWVRLGEYNVGSTDDEMTRESQVTDYTIIQAINHPQYGQISKVKINDIALYKLNRDVEFNEYVRPICLHTETQIPKPRGIISGWGKVGFSERKSEILLKGNVTFIPGGTCREKLGEMLPQKAISNIKDDPMICAGNLGNDDVSTDTCQGDSGGPLQYLLSDPYCMYSQVGITSFGIRCGLSTPAVYTRVSYYIPWIENIVWP